MSLSVGQSTIVGSVAFRKSSELSSSARGFLKIYGFSYGFPWVDGAGHEISAEVLNCCRSRVQSSCFVSSSFCNLFLYCKHYRQMLYTIFLAWSGLCQIFFWLRGWTILNLGVR